MNPENPHAMNRLDVLCVGMASYDLIFSIPRHLEEDEKGVASALLFSGGGPAANAAVGVSRLGLNSTFVGVLGQDAFGDEHLKEFLMEGVDIRFLRRSPAQTSISIALVKPDGKRAIVNFRQATPLARGSVDFSNVRPRVVLFDGHEPELSEELIRLAGSWNSTTILDAGSVHAGTRALAHHVDYLVCSQQFALDFTGSTEAEEALQRLTRIATNVVITQGGQGLLWKTVHGEGDLPAFQTKVVDTTGAGDAFHAAFAACLVWELDWDTTLRFSSAAAALCCQKMGARPGLPSKGEVDSFLRVAESP